MTRWTQLFTTLGFTGAITAAVIAACGGRPASSPGEMPRVAPPPEEQTPAGVPITPKTTPTAGDPIDAGAPDSLGPMSALEQGSPTVVAASQPMQADGGAASQPSQPASQPDAGAVPGSPTDAGKTDSNMPTLPPLPDGGVPVDSRLVPSRD